jgi:hypothetical protein
MLHQLVRVSTLAARTPKRHTCSQVNNKRHTLLNLDHGTLYEKYNEFTIANDKNKRNYLIGTYCHGFASGIFVYAGLLWLDNGSPSVATLNLCASVANVYASSSTYADYNKCRIAQNSFDKFILYREKKLNIDNNNVDKLLDDFLDYV